MYRLLFLAVICTINTLTAVDIIDRRAEIMRADYLAYVEAIGLRTDDPWYGGEVVAIAPGSPAASAGMTVGDIVLRWQGMPLNDEVDRRLCRAITVRAGRSLELEILRFGEQLTVEIPCTEPDGSIGISCRFTDGFGDDPHRPPMQRLLERLAIPVADDDQPILHRIPATLVHALDSWSRGPDIKTDSLSAFLAWYPLVLRQDWPAAIDTWNSRPISDPALPAAWNRWLAFLDAVTRGRGQAIGAHGHWYRLRHHPHPLAIAPLGDGLFRHARLREALGRRHASDGAPESSLADDLSLPGDQSDRAATLLHALAMSLCFDHDRETVWATIPADPAEHQLLVDTLTARLDDHRNEPALLAGALACLAFANGQAEEAVSCLGDWAASSPYGAQLLADLLLSHPGNGRVARAYRAVQQACLRLGLLIDERDPTMRQLRLQLGQDSRPVSVIAHHRPGAVEALQLWWLLLDRSDSLMAIDNQLAASKTDLNNLAWEYCSRTGFDGEGLPELYRRETLRATAGQVPAYLADTVAALDMMLGDQEAALVWQRHAVDNERGNNRAEFSRRLEDYRQGHVLQRDGRLWVEAAIDGGRAGVLDGSWHGPVHQEQDGWTIDGWMLLDRADGPWSFSRDGQVVADGHFHRDQAIGPWRFRDAAGRVIASGLLYAAGESEEPMRIGWWRFSDPDQGLHCCGPFVGGQPAGRWWLENDQGMIGSPQPWILVEDDPAMAAWVTAITAPLPELPAARPAAELPAVDEDGADP